jgi:tetratricopeptide (TPR) repeat protein
MKSRLFVVLLLLASSAEAQLDAGSTLRHLRVRVAFVNGVCDVGTRVRLIGRSGTVAESATNDQCEAEFANVPIGTYHVNVSGQNFANTDDIVSLSSGSTELEIKVKRTSDPDRTAGVPASAFVSAADLGIPAGAQKEFDKANELIGRQDLAKAIQRLNRAIAIYPAYAGAYNNLAVIYSRLGDRTREREVLQKAISVNDHFAPAYVNVGRMNIGAGDFPSAESALDKASSFDPTDAMTLVLLTYTEFMNRHLDQAIATSRKAHTLPGVHAFVHQVAARAYEQKRDAANAITELEQFLKEEPEGPRAEIARKELAEVRAIPH